ncbi:MAG: TonB-dependent receptor [Cyclobacteriaceae bacterium]
MKLKILQGILMLSKYVVYGIFIQVLLINLLLADSTNAQKALSVKEVDISILEENSNVKKLFEALEKMTDFNVHYDKVELGKKLKRTVTLSSGQMRVSDLLIAISRQANVKFKQVNRDISVLNMADESGNKGVALEIFADVNISGKITDENNEGLPGASIVVKGTANGTTTDLDGNFKLTVPEDAILTVSYVGYVNQDIGINGRTTVDVQLSLDAEQLEEIVIVGYGTQKKVSMTNAISTVKGQELARQSYGDLRKSLQGLVPGLTVVDNGGQPGDANFRLNIRGVSSINNSSPLILVDNIVQESLSGLDPNTIESVSVLKDAASTAIYGSRGANGIILITTKSGSKDKLSITYDGFIGFQKPTILPEFTDTEGYMRFMNTLDENSGGKHVVKYTEQEIQDYLQAMKTDPDNNPPVFYDWDDVFVKAPQKSHSLTISGGGNVVTSMANLSVFDQDGVYPNRNFKRYQIRSNNNIKLADRLSGHVNLFASRGDVKRPNGGAPYYFSVQGFVPNSTPFNGRVYDANGNYLTNGRVNVGVESDINIQGLRTDINDFLQSDLGIDWEPIEGLKYKVLYAFQAGNDQSEGNRPKYQILNPDGSIWAQNPQNSLSSTRRQLTRSTLNQVLTYEKQLDKHLFSALLGFSEEEYKMSTLSVGSSDFLTNSLRNYSSTTNVLSQQIDNSLIEWGLRSYFGRLRYNWDDKYLFEVSARNDGSSRFRKENRYTLFPAASVAWRVSNESFWQPLENVIDNFKIRYSWGINGNQNVAPYERFPALNIVNNVVLGEEYATGVIQRKAAGQNIIWEETSQHNLGMDFSVLNSKLEGSFDYFVKETTNILLELPVAGTFGLDAPRTNAGTISNKGWELSANWRDNIGEVTYNLGLTFASVTDKITDFAGLPKAIVGHRNGYYGREEGTSVVAVYGLKTDGYYNTQAEVDESAVWGVRANINPGDIKYVDINEDGVIDGSDIVPIGDTTPKYTFGLNTNAQWKGFDLSMFWQGAADVDTYLAGYLTESGGWANSAVLKLATTNYWKQPGDDDALLPLPQTKPKENIVVSEQFLLNGAYFRLKALSIGYSLPESILSKIKLSRVRIYYSGNNLITFSGLNKWGIDPEDAPYEADYLGNSNQAARHTYYSQLKSHNVGITLGF